MKALIVLGALVISGPAMAQYYGQGNSQGYGQTYGTGSNPRSTYVQPHYNSNGTYTQGHQRTTPNSTQYDNYGSRGNVNPYSGQTGTRSPRW